MPSGDRRIEKSRLIDDSGLIHSGDFILHSDGSFSESKGDEDVVEVIDGSSRVVTRSLQNWHTPVSYTHLTLPTKA